MKMFADLFKILLCDNTIMYLSGNKKREKQNNLSLPLKTN